MLDPLASARLASHHSQMHAECPWPRWTEARMGKRPVSLKNAKQYGRIYLILVKKPIRKWGGSPVGWRVGKMLPRHFENLTFLRFSDQLTQIPNGNPFFDFFGRFLTGLDLSKKRQDVRTIHFHPLSRRELRHASESLIFRR